MRSSPFVALASLLVSWHAHASGTSTQAPSYRTAGASLTLGISGRLVAGMGDTPLSTGGGALHALAGYYPVPHFGLRAGVRGDGGKGWGEEWCSESSPCGIAGVQFAALAVVPFSSPNRGFYVTAGMGLYQRQWNFMRDSNAAQSPFTFKLGGGYKIPTSHDSAIDVFMLGEWGRHTSFSSLEEGYDVQDDELSIPWLGLELGVAVDLGF